jgi:GNAT superfamily N-acetyltransferase
MPQFVGPEWTLERLRETAATLGWPRTCAVAACWLFVRRFLVYEWDLHAPQPQRSLPPGVCVTVLASKDVPALGGLDARMTPAEIDRRWAEGQECLLGWVDNRLAHYRWQGMRPAYMSYLDRVLRPLAGDQLVLDVYTRPDLRRRGLGGAVASVGRERGRDAGCTRAVWLIAWWNTPAHRIADETPWCGLAGSAGWRGLGSRGAFFTTGRVRLEPDGSLTVGAVPRQ